MATASEIAAEEAALARYKRNMPRDDAEEMFGGGRPRDELAPRSSGGEAVWSCDAVYQDLKDNPGCAMASGCSLLTVILINVIIVLSMSIEQVDSEHYAIPYNTVTGRIYDDPKTEGLHTKPPYGQFILWPKTYATGSEKVDCNSKDGVRITIKVRFQYMPRQKSLYELTGLYQEQKAYKKVMRWHARSAIRNGCADFGAQEFQTQRSLVQEEIYDRLRTRLDEIMGTDVIDVQLTNIERPAEYEREVDAKEGARNDIDKAENERAQAVTQANTVLLAAETAANKTLDTARTTAANTLTYADSEASVITGRYETLASTYAKVRRIHNMTSEALLTYVATRLRGQNKASVIGITGPAKVSYADELSTVAV